MKKILFQRKNSFGNYRRKKIHYILMDLLNILLKIEDDDFSYEVNDLLEEVRHFTLFSYARKG